MKVIQINIGRGRQAEDLVRIKAEEGQRDIAIILEPGQGRRAWEGWRRYAAEGSVRCEVWIRDSIEAITINKWTNKDMVTIKLNKIALTAVYEEGGKKDFGNVKEKGQGREYKGNWIVGGGL